MRSPFPKFAVRVRHELRYSGVTPRKMSLFLVTGASGFVGRHVCKTLHERGHKIRATRRSNQGALDFPVPVEWIDRIEIGPDTDWFAALDGVDYVIHLAALAHQIGAKGEGRLDEFMRINADGTRRLAEAIAVSRTVSRLVFTSSIGAVKSIADETITAATPCEPQSDYGRSKRVAELVIEEVLRETRADWCIIRPTLVYGPGNPGNMARLLKLVNRGMPLPFGAIRNQRSLVFVGNLADALVHCAINPGASRQTFLISDGENVSTGELTCRLARHARVPARIFPMPAALLRCVGLASDLVFRCTGRSTGLDSYSVERLTGSLAVDSSLLRSATGWQPPFTMDEGLAQTLRNTG